MSGFEALMLGRGDPFGALLPPMAKPPNPAGPKPSPASSGNILTGGVAGGGTVGAPPRLTGLDAPTAFPAGSTLTERLTRKTPVRGLARRIPILPPAPRDSGALARLLGAQGLPQSQNLSPDSPRRPEGLVARSVNVGGASQEPPEATQADRPSSEPAPSRDLKQVAESPFPLAEEKTAREKNVERERKRLEKNKDPKMIVRMEENRVWAIQNNRQVVFNISDNPRARGDAPSDRAHTLGFKVVQLHNATIEREARRFGVDPDLVRAIMYIENADENRFPLDIGAQAVGLADTLLPMNINPETWASIGGVRKEDFGTPEQNIRAGAALIREIQDRVPNPTPAKIGSIWQFTGRERVSNYGARVEEALKRKVWTIKPVIGSDVLVDPNIAP